MDTSQTPSPQSSPPQEKRKVMVVVPDRNGGRGVRAIGRHFGTGQTVLEVTKAEYEALLERKAMGIGVALVPDGFVPEDPAQTAAPKMNEAELRKAAEELQRARAELEQEKQRLEQERTTRGFGHLQRPLSPPPAPTVSSGGGLIVDPAAGDAVTEPSDEELEKATAPRSTSTSSPKGDGKKR